MTGKPHPFLIAALACMLWTQGALAQSTDAVKKAQGQALYDEALKDMEAHNYGIACPKLQQVIRLVPEGIGARITLGECFESQGKLASAWTMYREAQAMAKAAGQKERETKSKTRAEALEPKLSKLTLSVPEAIQKLSGLKIEKDGESVDAALWNLPLAVDVGEHRIGAVADGKESWKKTVQIAKNGDKSSIEIGPLTDKPQAPAQEPPKTPGKTGEGKAPPPEKKPPSIFGPPSAGPVDPFYSPNPNAQVVVDPTARRIIGIGLGVLGLGVAGLGGYVMKTAIDDENALYDSYQCEKSTGFCVDDGARQAKSDAEDQFNLSIGLLIGGGAAALIGITVFVTATSYVGPQPGTPAKPAGTARREANPRSIEVGLGLGSAMIRGVF